MFVARRHPHELWRSQWSALDELLSDYRFVRAGDLDSLAFCHNWKTVDAEECGYAMRLEGTSLVVTPDPFDGRTLAIEVAAKRE